MSVDDIEHLGVEDACLTRAEVVGKDGELPARDDGKKPPGLALTRSSARRPFGMNEQVAAVGRDVGDQRLARHELHGWIDVPAVWIPPLQPQHLPIRDDVSGDDGERVISLPRIGTPGVG